MDRTDQNLLEQVDARTKLAGSNKMEILLFSLGTHELFGINVFKVREVSRTPIVTPTPNMPSGVEGLISLRGNIIPVLSLARIMNLEDAPEGMGGAMMVTEYSKRTLGFLVHEVDRIIRVDWDRVRAPESVVTSEQLYITAITELDDGGWYRSSTSKASWPVPSATRSSARSRRSAATTTRTCSSSTIRRSPARRSAEVLDKLNVRHKHATNGAEAWARLLGMAAHTSQTGQPLTDEIDLILVDAEMPEMDGYVLTRHIKNDPRFTDIPVVMHSSLSSEANRAMGKSVGVDAYVAKFDAEVLADTLRPLLQTHKA
jgi:two-component system chemotaxis response regulator CheV